MTRLYVIAGHGAGDPGAVGGGYNEAERVRTLAKRIKELGGDNVILHDVNENVYASGRMNTLNVPSDAQVVELHMDSASSDARGAHIVINASFNADEYDTKLASRLAAMFPGRSITISKRSDLANCNIAANRGISYRLTENGFISNDNDRNTFNANIDALARLYLDVFGISSTKAGWVSSDKGWWYRNADGSYPRSKWVKIGGLWYRFDANGYALTGWQKIDGKWYYLNTHDDDGTECAMRTGWLKKSGYWYLLDDSGAMLTGWQQDGGYWYYLQPSESNGAPDGSMVKGWLTDGAKRYYLRTKREGVAPEGSMVTGVYSIGGKKYTFGADGALKN